MCSTTRIITLFLQSSKDQLGVDMSSSTLDQGECCGHADWNYQGIELSYRESIWIYTILRNYFRSVQD